jgi:hypothetical protein
MPVATLALANVGTADSMDASAAIAQLAAALPFRHRGLSRRQLAEQLGAGTPAAGPPLMIHSHGRSGSTLLLEIFGHDPNFWTSYEPLKAVRELPWQILYAEAGRCRDPWQASPSLEPRCPLRDAMLLSSLLACDTMPLQAVWYQELEFSGMRGQWLAKDKGAAWHRTYARPNLAQDAVDKALADQRACLAKPQRAIKTVRLNGRLDALYNVSQALGHPKPVVLHLIRDPRAVYASRKHVGGPTRGSSAKQMRGREVAFWVPNATMGVKGAKQWAASLCVATSRDKETGARHPEHYELLNFTEFVRAPEATIRGIYARHLKRPVPEPVLAFLRSRFPPSHAAAPAALEKNNRAPAAGEENSAAAAGAKEENYDRWGTGARNVDAVESQWKGKLEEWELQGIGMACKKTWDARSKTFELDRRQRSDAHRQYWRAVSAGLPVR